MKSRAASKNSGAFTFGRRTAPVRAPKGLGREAREWWKRLQAEYGIADVGGLATLELGARAFDRMTRAAQLVDADGCVVRDRWGQAKPHPAAATERDARAQVLHALKALHLDVEPLNARPGRPPGSR